MEIRQVRQDKERGTVYYNIEDIANWDLENLYRLLVAEKERARIIKDVYRGSEDLLKELQKLAKERQWNL